MLPAPPHASGEESRGKFARVHAIVRRIPRGRVTTYGRLARLVSGAGYPLSARAAGWAMRACPPDVPWHRVVNAEGQLSAELRGSCPPGVQRALLERELVRFDGRGQVVLDGQLWDPPPADLPPLLGPSSG